MITAIKIILMLVIILVLSYPFISVKGKKLRKIFVASSLRYYSPNNRKNVFFVILSIVEYILAVLLFKIFDKLSQLISSIPFLGKLIVNAVNGLNSQIDYVVLAIKMVLVNLIVVYAFIILKALLKKFVINPIFHIGKNDGKISLFSIFKKKKNKKNKKNAEEDPTGEKEEDSTEEEDEKLRKRRRIPDFVHSLVEDDEEDGEEDGEKTDGEGDDGKKKYGVVTKFIYSIFFEGDEFQYARPWVIRARMILQLFIRLVEILYLVFLTVLLASVFFALPMPIYNLLVNVLHVGEWYIYPAISIIFLQEICNVFDTFEKEEVAEDVEHKEEENEDHKRDARIRALLAELKKRFDSEHSLRYYPEVASNDVPQYQCTNVTYASALEYIRKQMELSSGRVVQSYMECLDAIYSDAHVYFAASFYSELGEYLIAYTYIRLLSGARMIFVVSDPQEKETLKTFISDRLMRMTGSSPVASWRVYTAKERLDQADVLIASPEDFGTRNIVEQYPGFFEEASNAIFIDADKIIAMDSYLCPVIATRLKKATNNRIRFVFLSLDLLKGFAARNLPKFFCVDKVLNFSSAKENEAVSYVLWNKESKNRRIYNKHGQKPTCLEIIIAEQAFNYGMDGVRLISEAPLEHAERQILALHNVEINNLYKNIVDVNYMIYSDDRCNLSAALYACTRFRGRKKSVVHILSKPYLLREYFMSKANTEDYINRSSFIQPRVTEHAEGHKLSLLRIFCEVTTEGGLSVDEFEAKMRSVITTQKERGDNISSVFCRKLIESKKASEFKLSELAAYLVAGLCDSDPFELTEAEETACLKNSAGNRAKDFYLIIDPACQDCFALAKEKKIVFNRIKEVFERVFAYNRRVELRLNDEVIGLLDTFPGRVHLEYIVGQSIIYRNSEYEIEHIAEDGSAIYLRHENISIKNCLDTVLLRHYQFESLGAPDKVGVLNNSTSKLEEIRVEMRKAKFTGTTFGFYSITSDRQTLDFYKGVEGNPHSEHPSIRSFKNGKVLSVTLSARMECTDGMRLLLAAVCNEFIRTIFPRAYHCVAICPILAEPMKLEGAEDNVINRIRTLYPFLKNPEGEFVETDSHKIRLLMINDTSEDMGTLGWFFDPAGRYMQEFLANIYSYLHWLKRRPGSNHFVYFGGEALPECYDLEGCCELLSDFNLVLSDDGKKDFETAGDDVQDDKIEYCSFCHKPMESGRFSFFDKHRFICADCFETVDDPEQLDELYISMREYLNKNYPEISFGSAKVKFDSVYELKPGQILSEFYYRMDYADRTVYVEIDEPTKNVRVSILRGIISLWQAEKGVANHYSSAQLYFEEIQYLRSIGENVSADWIYNALSEEVRTLLDEINEYVNGSIAADNESDEADETENTEENAEENTEENSEENGENDGKTSEDESEKNGERRTSFMFMINKGKEIRKDSGDDHTDGDDSPIDGESHDGLYDPNKIPRFWKRYLRGQHADDGKEDEIPDDAVGEDEEEGDEGGDEGGNESENESEVPQDGADETPNCRKETIDLMLEPNAPLDNGTELENDNDVTQTEGTEEKLDPAEEKRRRKEERKRQREERRRQKQLEWERSLDEIEEEERKRKGMYDDPAKDESKKKKTKKKDKSRDEDQGEDSGDNEDNKGKKKWWSFGGKKKKTAEDGTDLGENGDEIPEDPHDTDPLDDKDKNKDNGTGDNTEGGDDTDNGDNTEGGDDTDNGDNTEGGDDTDNGDNTEGGDDTDNGDNTEDGGDTDKDKGSSKKGKKKNGKKDGKKGGKKLKDIFKKVSPGEKLVPYEEDEATNPAIRVYNDIVRAAYNYSEEAISRVGVSDDELHRIFYYVKGDYPELFWVYTYRDVDADNFRHVFRCKDANEKFKAKEVNKDREALRKAAKTFTKGITRKTDPYKALLTIYRRLILTLDYDTVGLNAHIDKDLTNEDPLRSLRSALIKHKVVCAGYAVAMQYLLHSVGIVCAYVISESNAEGDCHAFNILKLGKYCYYLDATWGDSSDTSKKEYKNDVSYDYCCVPYSDFIKARADYVPLHMPRKELYPMLETFKYSNHEYYRYHNAYLKSYSEQDIIRIFTEATLAYDEEEMGRFIVSFRCSDGILAKYVMNTLSEKGKIFEILEKARAEVAKKNKKAAKLLEVKELSRSLNEYTGVVSYYIEKDTGVKKKTGGKK